MNRPTIFEMYRGDTFGYTVSFTTPDETAVVKEGEEVPEVPYMLQTGDTVKFGVKVRERDTEYVLYSETVVGEPTSDVEFSFAPEDTAQVKPGEYIFEMELTCDDGATVITVFQYKLFVRGDIIHD